MDAVDRMQDCEQRMLDAAIGRALGGEAPRTSPGGALCRLCGNRISGKRLRALPSATTCVGCQRKLEGGGA